MGATTNRVLLRAKTRRYADMVAGGSAQPVFGDTDVDEVINDTIAEYYELLVSARGQEYFLKESTAALGGGNLVAGTASYTLPVDLFELTSITLEWNSITHELLQPIDSALHLVHFAALANVWSIGSAKGFRITGDQTGTQNLIVYPTPGSPPQFTRVRYVPTFTPLAADGTLLFIVNGFDKLIAIAAAKELRAIKGLPTASLDEMLGIQSSRIQDIASQRLADYPDRVVDVSPETGSRNIWPPPRFM